MAEVLSSHIIFKSECLLNENSNLDWKDINLKESKKCGEIVLIANTEFLFMCRFCDERFHSIFIFQNHIKGLHIPDSEANKDPLNLPSNDQDSNATTVDFNNQNRDSNIFFSKQTCKKTTNNIINIDSDVPTENCNNQDLDANNQSDTDSDSSEIEEIFLTPDKRKTVNKDYKEYGSQSKNLKGGTLLCKDIEDLLIPQKKVPKKRNRKKKVYSCSFCQLSAGDKRSLENHLLSNHGTGTRHQCEECGKCFRSGSNLRAHLVIHSGTRPFKCDLCDSGFSHPNNLKTHRYIHTGERPHKCNQCDKGFVSSSACKAHMREHTGERPFVCHICERRFANKFHYNKHMINHSGRRDHVCEKCNMAFKQKETLTKHMVCHTNEKRFVCDVCPNRFAHRKNLVQHKKLHSDVKQYVCKVCSKDFAQHAGLYSHMKYHKKKD